MFGIGILGQSRLGGKHSGGGGAWNPSYLFVNDEQGAWYDPSDLSTMFQDAAGTTPVTADGQPVGLILDKSKGLVLGPENVPSDYFTSSSGWTFGSGFSLSGGALVFSSVGSTQSSENAIGIVSGKFVKVTYTVSGFSGPVGIGLNQGFLYTGPGGTGALIDTRVSANGTFTFYGYALGNTLAWLGRNGSFFTVTNISVKEVAGNHATQSTAASRPLYKTDGTYHWLQFDGVDDSLSTGNIDFTSVVNLSAFHGLFTNTPTALQLPWAMGGNPDGIAGNFGHYLSYIVSGNNSFGGSPSAGVLVNGVPAPVTYKSVATDLLDQSAPTAITQATMRLNGVPQVMSTLTGGPLTGAVFGNLPLYLGFRQAANDMRFNGNIYSLIVRGALSTTQEITATETWVAAKTGVTLL